MAVRRASPRKSAVVASMSAQATSRVLGGQPACARLLSSVKVSGLTPLRAASSAETHSTGRCEIHKCHRELRALSGQGIAAIIDAQQSVILQAHGFGHSGNGWALYRMP